MESGFLVYKCRRCGKSSKKTHVPNGVIVLNSIINDFALPSEWGGFIPTKLDICNCDNNNLGVADLIGFEKD